MRASTGRTADGLVTLEARVNLLLLLALLADPAPEARAVPVESKALRVSWEAPPGCPSEARLRARILRLVGSYLNERTSLPIVSMRAWREERRWGVRLHLVLNERQTERELYGETCAAVADAATLIVALTVAPGAAAEIEQLFSAAELDDVEEPPTTIVAAAPPPAPVAPSWRWQAGAAGAALVGPLPSLDGGVTLEVGAVRGWALIELFASYFLPRASDSALAGDFWLASGGLRGCADAGLGAIALGGCAELETGRLAGRGQAMTSPRTAHDLWLAAALGPELTLPLGEHLSLRARVSAVVPLRRPRFTVTIDPPGGDAGTLVVHRPAAVGGRATLGLVASFP